MKKKKLAAKLTKTKKKLAKAEAKVKELKAKEPKAKKAYAAPKRTLTTNRSPASTKASGPKLAVVPAKKAPTKPSGKTVSERPATPPADTAQPVVSEGVRGGD